MKSRSKMRIGRRNFVRGAGGSVLALPLLASLDRRVAAAAEPPQRIVFVYLPQNDTFDGMVPASGGAFSLAGTYLEALEPFASRVLLAYGLQGAHGHYGGHSECLTGWPDQTGESWKPSAGPSIDQLIAARVGDQTPLASLQLTVKARDVSARDDGTISWTESGLAIPHIHDPYQAFTKVFGDGGVDPADEAEQARLRAMKLGLVDALQADHARIRTKLDAADRQLLDQHLALLEEQEQHIIDDHPLDCATGGDPPPNDMPEDYDQGYWPDKLPQQIGVLVGALRCDATRVASLMLGFSGETNMHEWTGNDVDFHDVSHGSNTTYGANLFTVRAWEYGQIASLVQQLADISEGEGTLLDHTTIVCVPELGLITADDEQHSREGEMGVGCVIIGDAGGYFGTGRSIHLGGASYHRLLLTLVHAMGFEDVGSVGAQGTSVLDQLRA